MRKTQFGTRPPMGTDLEKTASNNLNKQYHMYHGPTASQLRCPEKAMAVTVHQCRALDGMVSHPAWRTLNIIDYDYVSKLMVRGQQSTRERFPERRPQACCVESLGSVHSCHKERLSQGSVASQTGMVPSDAHPRFDLSGSSR